MVRLTLWSRISLWLPALVAIAALFGCLYFFMQWQDLGFPVFREAFSYPGRSGLSPALGAGLLCAFIFVIACVDYSISFYQRLHPSE